MENRAPLKWQEVRRQMAMALVFATLLAGALSAWLWEPFSGLISAGAVLCFALGLWITEMLVGVFTGVKKANPTALAFLLCGKFLWWGSIFAAAKFLPRGFEKPVALGIGFFLLAILVSALGQYGMPKITDGNSS